MCLQSSLPKYQPPWPGLGGAGGQGLPKTLKQGLGFRV
jgi:hypothetical protein